jgi:hypothetical protein
MSIMRVAACLIVVPCILPGAVARAAACNRAPCPPVAAAHSSPLAALKSLFGVEARAVRQPSARAGSVLRPARTTAVPLPRARPPTLNAAAFPRSVFAAAPLDDAEDTSAGPAGLIDDAFNAIAMHGDDEYPALKAALAAYGGRVITPPRAP